MSCSLPLCDLTCSHHGHDSDCSNQLPNSQYVVCSLALTQVFRMLSNSLIFMDTSSVNAGREPRKRRNLDPFCQEETSDEDTKHVKPLSWFWWCLPHLVSIRWKLTTNHYPHHCYHGTYVFYDGNCKRGEKSLRKTRRQTSWHTPLLTPMFLLHGAVVCLELKE